MLSKTIFADYVVLGLGKSEMSRFREKAETMVEALGLEWPPIAGKFADSADERGDNARKLRVCEAFDVVRREGVVINFSRENCICPGGRHFTGLESLPLERIATVWAKEHKAYESMDVAMASVSKQPQPVKRGDFFILGPLGKFETDPDFVLLFVNPVQACRILGLVSFKGAEPFTCYPVSNVCSTITNTLAKGRPEINFLSVFERRQEKWSPNEFILALPWKDFEVAVESIPNSGFGSAKTETPA
jgi:uncharacterized protein (DUF169 family)